MASILDRYGIKEVADVTFYELDNNGRPTNPVLYLDTLKVSTTEQTAENTSARGGKGNPELIMWDYGKEINVTLEDALFSAKSMAIMFGNGQVVNFESNGDKNLIMKTEVRALTAAGTTAATWTDPKGNVHDMINPKVYNANGKTLTATIADKVITVAGLADEKVFVTYDVAAKGAIIEISASSFPGTYYVTGDTYARSEASGEDEFFQFIIPKAKVLSENTITMEAEGDPSVFNMSLRVLRPTSGGMMRLVKYELADEGVPATDENLELIHNHVLEGTNQGGATTPDQGGTTNPDQGGEVTPPPVADPGMDASVAAVPASTHVLLGKQVSDLVGDDIKIAADGSVSGTLKAVSDYTEFSSVSELQSGHYFPVTLGGTGTTMTLKKNGVAQSHVTDVPYDPELVLRVENNDTEFAIEVDGVEVVKFNFKNATLAVAG